MFRFLLSLFLLGGSVLPEALAGEPPALLLWNNAQVNGEGVFLSQIVARDLTVTFPQVRLADSPAFGKSLVLTREEVAKLLKKAAPEFVFTNWTGADKIRITRLSRPLAEPELKEQLTSLLQREYIKDKGELELHFSRPWTTVAIPDEAFTLKVLDLPATGITLSFILRFELNTGKESLVPWQMPLTAKVWKDIWVAQSPLRKGQLFTDAEVVRERRDVLGLRDAPVSSPQLDSAVELAENVSAGNPVYARSLRVRPVVHRGQLVDAQLQDGTIQISLKVEVLESGAPGQLVRVRNPQSRREFRGKVQDEQTILIPL